jgi:O-antigen/teichoic acid export membrane protein
VIVAQGWSIEFQFGALLLGEALIVVLVLRLARRSMRGVAAYGEPVTLGTWFAEATPIAWAALIATAYTRFDQFYIAHFAGGETLGNYTLAARVLEPCAFVAAAFASTIYARTSGIIMGKYDIASAHGIALRWLPTFSGAVPLERIGSVMIIFRCINLSLTALIQAAGAYVAILRLTRFNLVLVPVLVVCGDRLAGVIGVAVGVALAEGINSAIQLRMFQGLYPRSVRQGVSV